MDIIYNLYDCVMDRQSNKIYNILLYMRGPKGYDNDFKTVTVFSSFFKDKFINLRIYFFSGYT